MTTSETSPEARHARHFFVAWAMATLFHQASFMRLASDPIEGLLSLAAVAVLLMPQRLSLFVAMLVIQVIEIAWRAPVVSNHWWMSGFISLTLLLTLVPTWRQGYSPAAWRERFAPPLRAILIVVYFFGVFHKINADFFDPEISCGIDLYRTLAEEYLPFLPRGTGASWFSIIGTLAVETVIPIMLLIPAMRRWGIALGVGFHFFLGFVPYSVYYNFSSALFALYLLYLEPEDIDLAVERTAVLRRAREHHRIVLIAFLLFFAVGATMIGGGKPVWRHLYRIPWVFYGGMCVCIAGVASFSSRPTGRLFGPGAPTPLTLLVPLLFFLNGLSPYLGLKTETSLAMYSNLRTEGGVSNHLIVRGSLDPFDRTHRIVQIERSSDRKLRKLKREGSGMLWFEFRDHLARHPKASVTYRIGDERVVVKRAGDDPQFAQTEPWWIRKFVYFRPVDLDPRKRCSH